MGPTLIAYFSSCWLRRKDSGSSPVSICNAEIAVEQKAPHTIHKALCCTTSNLLFTLSEAELYAKSHYSPILIKLNFYNTQPFYGTLGFCPGLPGWTGTRKVKPIWIYWARDSEWQWHQLGHMQICTLTQTFFFHASAPPLSFLLAGCPSCHQTNSIEALKDDYRRLNFYKVNFNLHVEQPAINNKFVVILVNRFLAPSIKYGALQAFGALRAFFSITQIDCTSLTWQD